MLRAIAASFNAIAMVALVIAGGPSTTARAILIGWGSAGAAVVAAIVVLTDGPDWLGWVAIGYVLGAAIVGEPPAHFHILLTLAFMPLLRRPRGSLVVGIGLTVVTAMLFRQVLVRLL